MEGPPEKRAERRQEVPELQIVPLERGPEEIKMPPGMVDADISKVLEKQQQKDREKRKKTPRLNN